MKNKKFEFRGEVERASIPDDDAHNWMKTLEEGGFTYDEIDKIMAHLNKTYRLSKKDEIVQKRLEDKLAYLKSKYGKVFTEEERKEFKKMVEAGFFRRITSIKMQKSFLQTQEWLEFQKEVGHKTWRFDDGPTSPGGFEGRGKIRANIIKLGLPLGKSILYIPHGPEIDFEHIRSGIKNELTNFVKYLKDLARKEKAIFVKMEPLSDMVMELLYRRGIKRSSKQIQPYRTVIIDLNLPEEHLLGRMHQKTRYNINLSEKKGLNLEESSDVETFWKLLKQTAKKDQFSTHPKEYYEKMLNFFKDSKELQTKLFFVKYENKPIGAALVMIYHPFDSAQGDPESYRMGHNSVYYLHGAMDRDYKSLMVPYFMHWEIIKKLKIEGCKFYDLWGIDAKKWPGVTRFKLGWGGELKEYPGSFDMPVSRLWYLAYSLARKIF